MTIILALAALGAIAWILLPLFGKGAAGRPAATDAAERDRLAATDVVRGALDELEADHTEGKVDPEGYQKAKAELTGRLAGLEAGGRGKRAAR